MIKNNAKYNILKNLFLENSIVSEISSGLKVELDSGIPTGRLNSIHINTNIFRTPCSYILIPIGGLNIITTSILIFLGHLVVILLYPQGH